MPYPPGVQTSTLTFSNSLTFLGNEATRTEVTVQATAGVVWTATGQPIDDFAELVAPSDGMPGSLTVPFVDQAGFTDQAGNDFTMWAYVVTRKTFFRDSMKTVKKTWQPILGQTTVDFDNLPGGSVGLPVSAPPVPVTSVAGLTGLVTAEGLAGQLEPLLPAADDPTVAAIIADPESTTAGVLSATYARAFEASTSIVYDAATGNVTSSTEGGITTTYTYNADGTVNTETRLGKVRTWAYDATGNPTSSTVV